MVAARGGVAVTDGDGDGDGVNIRPLRKGDIQRGLLEALDALRPASGLMSGDRAEKILWDMISDANRLVAVAEVSGAVVGTATILFETKLIHGGGTAGHIEDVAVRREYQGAGIGGRMVRYLLNAAHERGCYKTVLDCEDGLVGYYQLLGFERFSNGMRYNHSGRRRGSDLGGTPGGDNGA